MFLRNLWEDIKSSFPYWGATLKNECWEGWYNLYLGMFEWKDTMTLVGKLLLWLPLFLLLVVGTIPTAIFQVLIIFLGIPALIIVCLLMQIIDVVMPILERGFHRISRLFFKE